MTKTIPVVLFVLVARVAASLWGATETPALQSQAVVSDNVACCFPPPGCDPNNDPDCCG